MIRQALSSSFFFFNDTATTEIYTLSLHDALPIFDQQTIDEFARLTRDEQWIHTDPQRSEEHTSELQSQSNLVCRLLLEKKKKKKESIPYVSHLDTPQIIIST